jgi:hypothetical protein
MRLKIWVPLYRDGPVPVLSLSYNFVSIMPTVFLIQQVAAGPHRRHTVGSRRRRCAGVCARPTKIRKEIKSYSQPIQNKDLTRCARGASSVFDRKVRKLILMTCRAGRISSDIDNDLLFSATHCRSSKTPYNMAKIEADQICKSLKINWLLS